MVFTHLIIFREFWKFIKQMLGRENIFGHRSTAANQLFLLYCLGGSFYYTDKIHWHIKYLFVSLHLSGLSLGCVLAFWHLLYRMDSEPWFHVYVFYFIVTPVIVGICIPIILYRYKNSIETAFQEIDVILTSSDQELTALKKSGSNKLMNIKKVILINLISICAFVAIMCTSCVIDVIIFYEDSKASNVMYYMIPIPETEKYGRLEFFLITNAVCSTIFGFIVFQWEALVFLIVLWYAICHNQIALVGHRIRARSAKLEVYASVQHEVTGAWNRGFEDALVDASNRFQQIIRTKNKFDEFVEIACTIMLPGSFCIELAELYLTLSTDMSTSVQLKETSHFLGLGWTVLIIFWIADRLDSSISQVSLEVYSSPWYWSKKVRKQVHLTLCQTQRVRIATIMGVWPLDLKSFARYGNGLMSYVSVLRRLVNKSN